MRKGGRIRGGGRGNGNGAGAAAVCTPEPFVGFVLRESEIRTRLKICYPGRLFRERRTAIEVASGERSWPAGAYPSILLKAAGSGRYCLRHRSSHFLRHFPLHFLRPAAPSVLRTRVHLRLLLDTSPNTPKWFVKRRPEIDSLLPRLQKIRALSRHDQDYQRESKFDVEKVRAVALCLPSRERSRSHVRLAVAAQPRPHPPPLRKSKRVHTRTQCSQIEEGPCPL